MQAVERFGRLVTAMVTPFRENLTLDLDRAGSLASYLVAHGSESLVVAGTTGESPTLTEEEKLQLFEAVKRAVGDRGGVIANTGSNSTASSVTLTRKATELGVDGIMAVVPYYNKPSQEGLYDHFRAVAEATHLPVMLYNVPGRTGANLEPATVARLAEIPNIIALKEASGQISQAGEVIRLVPSLDLYSGDDALTLPLMAIGAAGVVSVASHITGPAIAEMMSAYLCGHRIRAMELHLALLDLFQTLFIASNPVPVKEALAMTGMAVGGIRQPLAPLTAEQRTRLVRCLSEVQPDLLDAAVPVRPVQL